MEVRTCNLPACSCQLTGGTKFCSDECREASKDVATHDTCKCQHAQCGPHA